MFYTTTFTIKKIIKAVHRPACCTSSALDNKYSINAATSSPCNLNNCHLQCKLNSIIHEKLITFDVATSTGVQARVLLDCGSTTNFISKRFVLLNHIPTVNTANSQVVKLADGSVTSTCKLVNSLHLYFNDRDLCESLLVFPIDSFDIILGMPWLKKHNPNINWLTDTVTFPMSPLKSFIKENLNNNNNNNNNSNNKSKQSAPTPSFSAKSPPQVILPSSIPFSSVSSSSSKKSKAKSNPLSSVSSTASSTIPPVNSPIEFCHISAHEVRKSMKKGEQFFLLFVRKKKQGNSSDIELTNLNSHSSTTATTTSNTNTDTSPDQLSANILHDYCDVFPEDLPKGLPPKRFIEHKIKLEPGSTPTFRNHHRLSPQDMDELKIHLKDLLDHGFIRESHSPYGAPILFAKKAGDTKRRLCIDYRDLNRITIKDRYPLPRVDELIDRLFGAKYFTKLDLRSGYHQVRVAEEDIQKTAFNTRYGQFEYLVVPFGLTSAPSTFMALMNHILHPYLDKFAIAYLDDVLIYSKTLEEHELHVRTILDEFRKHKLYAKESKCEFFKSEVKFLGFIVGADGVKVDPAKIEAVKVWPVPKSITDVRSFLGFVGFYRKFIKNHSAVVAPISDLTKTLTQGSKFIWTPAAQIAFEQMIDALCSAPVLVLPDPTKPYVVTTDASGYALGACLMQDHGNGLQPIVYMSKKMLPAETRYPIHHKEMLAIVCALKEWRHYLHGAQFKIRILTDHKSLVHFNSQPKLSERQARWNEFISEFGNDIIIEYQEGKKNVVADALSRRADYIDDTSTTTTTTTTSTTANVSIDDIKLNDDSIDNNLNTISVSINTTLTQQIQDGYQLDSLCKQILVGNVSKLKKNVKARTAVQRFSVSNGLIYYDIKRIYIPDVVSLKTLIISEHHDNKLAGHIGYQKTYDNITRNYYWPNMYIDIKLYVRSCLICQRTKSENRKPAGLLHPLPIPIRRWQCVTMDFIVQLPKTKNGYDAIMVVVDKLSKRAYFIPTTTTATAPDTALLYFKHVSKNGHGIPEIIVSDRDSKFTSLFWKSLWSLLDTKLAMSTAFHPETDGQTERMNRTLEQMLRAYSNKQQDNWDELLPYCEMAYNNSKNVSTGYSPFFLNYGQDMSLPANLLINNDYSESAAIEPIVSTDGNAAVETILTDLRDTLITVQSNLTKAQAYQKKYADQHRRHDTFKLNERVLLDTSDITFTTGTKKLLDKYIGPYKIIEVISDVAYKLDLPIKFRLHPVFHISKLKRVIETDKFPDRKQLNRPTPVMKLDGKDAWYVERIIGKRIRAKKVQYLVKWEDYPEWESTWEPIQNVKHAQDAIDEYEQTEQQH